MRYEETTHKRVCADKTMETGSALFFLFLHSGEDRRVLRFGLEDDEEGHGHGERNEEHDFQHRLRRQAGRRQTGVEQRADETGGARTRSPRGDGVSSKKKKKKTPRVLSVSLCIGSLVVSGRVLEQGDLAETRTERSEAHAEDGLPPGRAQSHQQETAAVDGDDDGHTEPESSTASHIVRTDELIGVIEEGNLT